MNKLSKIVFLIVVMLIVLTFFNMVFAGNIHPPIELGNQPLITSASINDSTYRNIDSPKGFFESMLVMKSYSGNRLNVSYSDDFSNYLLSGQYERDIRDAVIYTTTSYPELFIDEDMYDIVLTRKTRGRSIEYMMDFRIFSRNYTSRELDKMKQGIDSMIDQSAGQIRENSPNIDNMSDLRKALTVYDWVLRNLEYDHEMNHMSFNSYGYIEDGKVVCSGYVSIFNQLLREFGINAIGVAGSPNDENIENREHIWTMTVLDGKTYYIDPTWADLRGDNPSIDKRTLFTSDYELFSSTHRYDKEFYSKFK